MPKKWAIRFRLAIRRLKKLAKRTLPTDLSTDNVDLLFWPIDKPPKLTSTAELGRAVYQVLPTSSLVLSPQR